MVWYLLYRPGQHWNLQQFVFQQRHDYEADILHMFHMILLVIVIT